MHGFLSFSLFTVSSGAMDVSGLEGGGRGARAERWGKGRTLISCEERKKTAAESLTSYLHIHSCLSLYLVCLRGPLIVSLLSSF